MKAEKKVRRGKFKNLFFFHNKLKYSSIQCPEPAELPYMDKAKEGCVKDIEIFLAQTGDPRGPQHEIIYLQHIHIPNIPSLTQIHLNMC